MALQGTLDTFELPDVLRLLASTRKTGRLRLRGDRGDGDVWLAEGHVVGVATAATSDDVEQGLFELLRAHEGSFSFEPGDAPSAPLPPADVEPLLATVETQLAEWREIEAVVPSLEAWVALAPELPGEQVSIDAETWRLVATIGSGLTVRELGQLLGLGEVPVCRMVRDVVDLGVVSVGEAPEERLAAGSWSTPDADPVAVLPAAAAAPSFEPAEYDPAAYQHEPAAYDPAYEPAAYEPAAYEPAPYDTATNGYEVAPEPAAPLFPTSEPAAYADPEPAFEAPHPASPFDVALDQVDDPDEADEVARQLAMLSPRAAQAIAAAAASDSEADRQAALDAVDDAEEPVNRGLLLKFLSSVK